MTENKELAKYEEMYPGIPFSPPTILARAINATDAIIYVADTKGFPPGPNLATIGEDENAETVLYAQVGEGLLSGCQREIEGVAKVWDAGSSISRTFTNKDYMAIIKNLKQHVGNLENPHNVSPAQIGAATTLTLTEKMAEAKVYTDTQIETAADNLNTHISNKQNPHGLTLAQIGAALGDASGNAQNSLKLGERPPEAYIQPQPNLLINGDFTVNQRGQERYEANNSLTYTFDRWFLANAGSIKKIDGILQLTFGVAANTYWSAFVQRYEISEHLRNKQITYSVLCRGSNNSDANIYMSDWMIPVTLFAVRVPPDNQWHVLTCSATVPDVAHENGKIEFSINGAAGTLDVAWAKAEIGSCFTGWYPVDPGEELLKCQRYFEIGSVWRLYNCTRPNILPGVNFLVPKRAAPRLTILSHLGENIVAAAWGLQAPANVTEIGGGSPIGVDYVNTDGLVAGEAYHYGYIADAEMY